MALTVRSKRLYTGLIGSTPATIYTAPAGVTARVYAARASNKSADEVTYSFWVPTGGGSADVNQIADQEPVAGADTAEIEELVELVIEPGWTLIAQANADNVLTVILSGTEETES